MNEAVRIDPWAWYRSALANPSEIGKPALPVHESEPQQGYYRVRRKGGQWEPIAIFYPPGSDELIALRGNREVADINALWVWCCRNPVSYDAYTAAVDGKGWEDEPPTAAGIGDNSNDADAFEALRIEFLGEKEQAEEILRKGITTQADADRASIWKDRMLKIRSRAQAMFKVEKQPVLDEAKRIDDKYRSLAHDRDSEPTAMAEKLRAGMEAFLKAQKRAEEERQRKAREEAEAARRAAEEAARKVTEVEQASDLERVAALAEAERQAAAARAAEAQAEARSVSAGRTGARTSIRVEKVGVVTDYKAAATALVEMKHKDIIEAIDALANRAAKAGVPFAGMRIEDREKVV